jgi:homoserine O-acetyltransferase
MTRALDYFDPAWESGGDLAEALAPAQCEFLVLSFSTDWRFSPARSEEMVNAMISARKKVSYAEIDAPWGHDAFLIPTPRYTDIFTAYMDRVARGAGA